MGTKQRMDNEVTDLATDFVTTFHFPVPGARYHFPVSHSVSVLILVTLRKKLLIYNRKKEIEFIFIPSSLSKVAL